MTRTGKWVYGALVGVMASSQIVKSGIPRGRDACDPVCNTFAASNRLLRSQALISSVVNFERKERTNESRIS